MNEGNGRTTTSQPAQDLHAALFLVPISRLLQLSLGVGTKPHGHLRSFLISRSSQILIRDRMQMDLTGISDA